jgi:hypothetical protein
MDSACCSIHHLGCAADKRTEGAAVVSGSGELVGAVFVGLLPTLLLALSFLRTGPEQVLEMSRRMSGILLILGRLP